MSRPVSQTRIAKRNTQAILGAALDVFSAQGFRGATLDQIAAAAQLSKPNLLYYFPSKEAVYQALLGSLLEDWVQPLRAINPEGDPVEEMLTYIRSKLRMSRSHARESRLFAGEVLTGADHIRAVLEGALRVLVDEKAALIGGWMLAGRGMGAARASQTVDSRRGATSRHSRELLGYFRLWGWGGRGITLNVPPVDLGG